MKKYNFFIILILFFITPLLKAKVIENKIFEKYDKIFLEKILSNNDVLNYQEIFKFQDNCEWKKANAESRVIHCTPRSFNQME